MILQISDAVKGMMIEAGIRVERLDAGGRGGNLDFGDCESEDVVL